MTTSDATTADLLARVPALHHLPHEELESLAHEAVRTHVDGGEVVFRQGDPPKALYVVLDGQVRVVSDVPAERVAEALREDGAVIVCKGSLGPSCASWRLNVPQVIRFMPAGPT